MVRQTVTWWDQLSAACSCVFSPASLVFYLSVSGFSDTGLLYNLVSEVRLFHVYLNLSRLHNEDQRHICIRTLPVDVPSGDGCYAEESAPHRRRETVSHLYSFIFRRQPGGCW